MSAHILGPGLGLTGLVTKLNPVSSVSLPGNPILLFDPTNFDGTGNSSLTDGGTIQTWKNTGSQASSDITQATAGLRPVFHATQGPNGTPCAESTGTQFWASGAITTINQPHMVVAIARPSNLTADGTIFDGGLAGNLTCIHTSGQLQGFAGGVYTPAGATYAANTWALAIMTFNGASSTCRFNNSSVPGGSAGANAITKLGIFALANTGTVFVGKIGLVAVYTDGTTASAVESYVAAKYGAMPQ